MLKKFHLNVDHRAKMPTDSYRFTGPEDSIDYRVFMPPDDQLSPAKTRKDRKAGEQRKIYPKMGVISQAKGSAYIELGDTKVMVGVYGPREIPKRSDFSMKGAITCEFKFAPFSCRTRRNHQQDPEEIEFSNVLKECIESTVRMNMYPKCCIDVFVTVLEDGGGTLAASITAVGLALADAKIELYDTLVGASVGVNGDTMLVDPSAEETLPPSKCQTDQGVLTVGYLNTMEQVVCLTSYGVLCEDKLAKGIDLAIKQCGILLPAIQQCQVEAFKQKLSKMPQA